MPTPLHITIAEPCHENWQQMTPNEQGRFCLSCQKAVVDFTLMSNKEILAYISNASGSTCGRFTNDQLDKTYQEEAPRRFSWKYAWNMLLATFLVSGSGAMAQQGKSTAKKSQVATKRIVPGEDNIMLGMVARELPKPKYLKMDVDVVDEKTGNPVKYAHILIKGKENSFITNEDGEFSLGNVTANSHFTIVVSANRYATKEYEVNKPAAGKITIRLKPAALTLKPVSTNISTINTADTSPIKVIEPALPSKEEHEESLCKALQGRVGGYVVSRTISRREKITRKMKALLPLRDSTASLQVSPNPVVAGNNLQVNLQVEQEGRYRLELLNTQGQIMKVQEWQRTPGTKSVIMTTDAQWNKGVYWLRLTSSSSKKVYNTKVLIQ